MGNLFSFDIDGTLEVGDPSGSVTMKLVRRVKDRGNLIGSCSDRPVSYQRELWDRHDIVVDFTVLKDRLEDVKSRFQADDYYHIGDTAMDEFFAERAGFHFIKVDSALYYDWSAEIAP